jgi:hypothetical protein
MSFGVAFSLFSSCRLQLPLLVIGQAADDQFIKSFEKSVVFPTPHVQMVGAQKLILQ